MPNLKYCEISSITYFKFQLLRTLEKTTLDLIICYNKFNLIAWNNLPLSVLYLSGRGRKWGRFLHLLYSAVLLTFQICSNTSFNHWPADNTLFPTDTWQ